MIPRFSSDHNKIVHFNFRSVLSSDFDQKSIHGFRYIKLVTMPRTRGQQRRTEPPPAGWRDQDATDDESEYDPNDQLLEDYDDEDNFENEQDEDIFEEEFESVGQCESGASRFVQECDETDSPASSKNWTLILILLTLVLVPVGSFYLYPNESFDFVNNSIDVVNIMRYKLSSPSNESENEAFVPSTPWDKFKHKFKTEFTPKYLNAVPKSSIKVIKAAVKDVMTAHEDSDKYEKLSPSVILILGKEGNKNVTCFSRDLERIISSSYNEGNPVRLKGDSIDASGIEAAFIDVFENKKQHLIVIDGLNKLDGKSAAHLHRFTDHE